MPRSLSCPKAHTSSRAPTALKRNGRPEEIAALFTLLLDERLGFLTGADIIMDGGVIASGATAELKNAIYFPHFLPLCGSKKF
ncbi:SDR family oxidoreductase [uncultured Gemmiger sp.]|uniref:SDR family oxidoreductase n=1 Tax=uncultured Gemmiger sp. TaxID=1623490 RepID=UPI0025E2C711|nr:SDR family oxidoreductase [uncultured Gemmiger sp.]